MRKKENKNEKKPPRYRMHTSTEEKNNNISRHFNCIALKFFRLLKSHLINVNFNDENAVANVWTKERSKAKNLKDFQKIETNAQTQTQHEIDRQRLATGASHIIFFLSLKCLANEMASEKRK